jgi:hypothetical protein
VTSGLTAAVRSFERSALYDHGKEQRVHATIRRYEGVDMTRTNEVVGKANETLVRSFASSPGLAASTSSRPATAS